MTSSQKNEPGNSRCSMLPKLAPRSTITSRARELHNTKGDTPSRIIPNTPHIERSRASSVCEELLKPAFGTKEKTFTSTNEAEPLNFMEADNLIVPDNKKGSLAETGGGDEEAVYMNKKNEFQLLKKDLEVRQSAILEMYSYLQELHGKIVSAGGEVELLEPVLQLLDLKQGLRGPEPIGDGLELPKRISELPAQLIAVCHELMASRDAIINYLKNMGSTNEIGRTNLASKLRQWGVESEALCVLVGSTAKTADRNTLNITKKVTEFVHRAMALNSENTQMKEQQLQLKTQLEQVKKQSSRALVDGLPDKSRASLAKQQPGSLIKMPSQSVYGGQRRTETEGSCGKEDLLKRQHDLELRTYRTRIRDLERDLKDLNTTYAAQTEILKSLESEVKQRESQHEARLRTLRDHVRTAEQKINTIIEERDKLQTSAQNAQEEGENLICGLKDRNADLEKALAEQSEKTANAMKKLAEEEIVMRDLAKKNDAEMAKECSRLKDLLTSAEGELETMKQKNSEHVKAMALLLESKERIESELTANKITTIKLNRELAELRDALFNVSQERDKYLESLEQKMDENGGPTAPEHQLHEANKYIAAKVEEVRKLQSIVASRDQDNQILAGQIISMEEHLKICQRRRVQYEKKITALGTEVQSLRSAQKRYSETWSDSILSKLSEEIPQLKDHRQQHAWDDFNQYPCQINTGDPIGHQSGDIFASVSELISQERNNIHQYNNDGLKELPSSIYQQHECMDPDRPQVVTILRPCRRVRLTPEMRLQPISSLMSALQRQSCVSTTEQAKTKDLFLMSNSNNVFNK